MIMICPGFKTMNLGQRCVLNEQNGHLFRIFNPFAAPASPISGPEKCTHRPANYHWRELPQESFLSRQKSCGDKRVFVTTKHVFCRDKSMLVLSWQNYVCRDKRRVLSRQKRVCREKKQIMSRQKFKHTFVEIKDVFCRDKHVFVATKIILVEAPANDNKQSPVLV